ncbi:MAG: respiratory nitrate reductase subunit gamma [Deltaproteobacteria bacterium]|jgi:nitrate reductase gamma subunit|nr:respiratory nitrate reductase subunit gamma [Deltaproteobacteria bacterium]MBW2532917.1 respiratory nitrate reductase subunit gamma [Deltaproteobacteria bacterium]
MALVPYIAAYAGIAIFLVASAARFMKYAKMPMHMRWELYPVMHEAGRAHYGGSYLEEKDWWDKPRETSKVQEAKAMAEEILFLVALKENNRKMWLRSFPFHFGLYLTIAALVLVLILGAVQGYAPGALAGTTAAHAQTGVVLLGVGGMALSIIGALGLLHRRMTAPELKDFTAGADLFNLVFFIAAFGAALATFWLVDQSGNALVAFVANLVTFEMAPLSGAGLAVQLPVASVVLLSALTAYVPLTHMSHFIGKYFAYHAIRWNDEPNLPGSEQEAQIQELLGRPVSWAAAHIGADGKKSWADVATTNPYEDKDAARGKKEKKDQ